MTNFNNSIKIFIEQPYFDFKVLESAFKFGKDTHSYVAVISKTFSDYDFEDMLIRLNIEHGCYCLFHDPDKVEVPAEIIASIYATRM